MSCAKRQLHCSERPSRKQRFTILAISWRHHRREATIHDLLDLAGAITSSWMQRFTIFSIARPIMSLQ